MKYHHLVLLCCAFISIFYTRTASADPTVNVYVSYSLDPEIIYYNPKDTVDLHCNSSEAGVITWAKGDRLISDVSDLKKRAVVSGPQNETLTLKDLRDSDAANYTCVLTIGDKKYNDSVIVKPMIKWGVKVAKNTNVVEGEKLAIKCEIKGDVTLTWYYLNTTEGSEGSNLTEITGGEDRWKLTSYYDEGSKRNVSNGEFKIEEVNKGDRGEYTCVGEAKNGFRFNSTSQVRIKDKYAALWPFLGICAEVFVLCAIIFIYEKKRNKTELEESDTDQSPDQKNTPDHGKESNLRHRQ